MIKTAGLIRNTNTMDYLNGWLEPSVFLFVTIIVLPFAFLYLLVILPEMTQIPQSRSNKIALSILLVGAVFWLGGINIRALIGNELLNYDQFDFRVSIPPDRENALFQMMSNASIVIVIAYFFVVVSAIWFMATTKLKVKENGWLLMCSILFFMFVPAEVYTNYLDVKFALLFHSNPPNHDELLKIFGERLGALSGVPVIALFCYYTIIPIAVFRPLRKKKDEEKKTG